MRKPDRIRVLSPHHFFALFPPSGQIAGRSEAYKWIGDGTAGPDVKMDKTGRKRLTGLGILFSVDRWGPFGARK
jgi:hypothetical protein